MARVMRMQEGVCFLLLCW